MPDPQQVQDLVRQENELGKEAFDILREFHRTLSTVSGVMAAGIILSGGEPQNLDWRLAAALLFFVLSLASGLVFLHSIYASYQCSRGDLRARITAALGYKVEGAKSNHVDILGQHNVLMSTVGLVAGWAQVTLVGAGFLLVLWGLGDGLWFHDQPQIPQGAAANP